MSLPAPKPKTPAPVSSVPVRFTTSLPSPRSPVATQSTAGIDVDRVHAGVAGEDRRSARHSPDRAVDCERRRGCHVDRRRIEPAIDLQRLAWTVVSTL